MTRDRVREVLLDILLRIAPDARGTPVNDMLDLRESLGLDSMDFLRFVTAIHERLAVDVPESAYADVTTLAGAVRYIEARVTSQGDEAADATT